MQGSFDCARLRFACLAPLKMTDLQRGRYGTALRTFSLARAIRGRGRPRYMHWISALACVKPCPPLNLLCSDQEQIPPFGRNDNFFVSRVFCETHEALVAPRLGSGAV
jgi:hypothetical protein